MIYALLGAAFAVAGADKLGGNEDYEEMFEDLGWSREGMGAVAAAEIAGGLMLGLRRTRRVGAAMLAGTSAAVWRASCSTTGTSWRGRGASCWRRR